MNEPRDRLVGDALHRIDVPDHAPDFWSRLDAGLAEAPDAEPPGRSEPGAAVIEIGSAHGARRSGPIRSRRGPAVAAAAAAVVALALGVGLPAAQQAADGDAQVDLSDRSPDPAPDAVQPVPDPETTTTTAPAPEVVDVTPEELAIEWLTLVRGGEVDAAYALLDESSQASLPLESFRGLAGGLAEGAGAFADLPPTVVPLIDDEGLAATAVVFTGDVEREGIVETASYAVVVTGDPDDPDRTPRVAFVLDGPRVEPVQRTNPGETRTSPVEVDVSPTAGATWAVVDASAPVRVDDGEATVSLDVEALAGPGTHTVVVISTEAGRYTARSFTVVVP